MIRGDTMTAVRVMYVLGVMTIGYGSTRALDYLETQGKGRLVFGLVITAIGMAVLILAGFRHRRMPRDERQPIYGVPRVAGAIELVIAAALAAFGTLGVWVMFAPDGGLKALPGTALFFGMAALCLFDARRKLRASRRGNVRAQPGRPGGSS